MLLNTEQVEAAKKAIPPETYHHSRDSPLWSQRKMVQLKINTTLQTIQEEIVRYSLECINIPEKKDPVQVWTGLEVKYPKLMSVAFDILTIPA